MTIVRSPRLRWIVLVPAVLAAFLFGVVQMEPSEITMAETFAETHDRADLDPTGWDFGNLLFAPLFAFVAAAIIAPSHKKLAVIASGIVVAVGEELIGGFFLGGRYEFAELTGTAVAAKILSLGVCLMVAEIARAAENDGKRGGAEGNSIPD